MNLVHLTAVAALLAACTSGSSLPADVIASQCVDDKPPTPAGNGHVRFEKDVVVPGEVVQFTVHSISDEEDINNHLYLTCWTGSTWVEAWEADGIYAGIPTSRFLRDGEVFHGRDAAAGVPSGSMKVPDDAPEGFYQVAGHGAMIEVSSS